ncbi:hypothetical protein BQ8482_160027 [Mesorhizobium delmotii]|uniref:Uncharacterized protein n=1 Tax=Mesorhizobium delmotii TaxID=1631247 RepID=A0A2P9AHG2_9HYPH|nr:hypothetical protein BQ8482_160027 [Mesorhizobium delmotii]
MDVDARVVRAIEPPLRLALMRIKAVASGEAIVVLTIAFWRLSNGLDASGVIGSWLLYRSFHRIPTNPAKLAIVAPLGVTAGFLDAAAPRSAICTALVSDRFQPLGRRTGH